MKQLHIYVKTVLFGNFCQVQGNSKRQPPLLLFMLTNARKLSFAEMTEWAVVNNARTPHKA